MMVHCAGSGTQCRHEFSFHCSIVRGFESFGRTEIVKRFDVARISTQPRLRQEFRALNPLAKFVRLAAICTRLCGGVSVGAVQSGFEFPRFVQLMYPKTRT